MKNASVRAVSALKIAAVAQGISAVEGLVRHRQFGRDHLLAGQGSKGSVGLVPRQVRSLLDTHNGAVAIHGLALAGAATQLLAGPQRRGLHIAAAAASLASNKAFEARNPYGRDGADQMIGVIFGYRLITALVPSPQVSDDLFLRGLNAQAAISYTSAGLAKAVSAEWLSGSALEQILRTNAYGGTPVARAIVRRPRVSRILTWMTVLWEASFPVIYLLPPRHSRRALWAAKAFHLGIAYTMGLPRFFWAFSAAHEAVSYVNEKDGAA